jgi:hypothetical protein
MPGDDHNLDYPMPGAVGVVFIVPKSIIVDFGPRFPLLSPRRSEQSDELAHSILNEERRSKTAKQANISTKKNPAYRPGDNHNLDYPMPGAVGVSLLLPIPVAFPPNKKRSGALAGSFFCGGDAIDRTTPYL